MVDFEPGATLDTVMARTYRRAFGWQNGDRMAGTDLAALPANQLGGMIRSRPMCPVELTMAVLGRVARLGRAIGAFADLDAGRAMAGARAMLMGAGPRHDLPVTVAGRFAVAVMSMRPGSRTTAPPPAPGDAPFVARLLAAGAIVAAGTTTFEFGWSGVSGSPLGGITHDPLRCGFDAGASSAGAAVPWAGRPPLPGDQGGARPLSSDRVRPPQGASS